MLASLLKRLAILLVANASISRFASLLLAFGLPLPVRVVAYTLVAAIGLVGAIWVWQESILYVPAIPSPSNPALGRIHRPSDCPAGFRSPSERGLPFEDVHLISSDGVKCHAWFFPAPKRESASTILFSHENAGPMSLRLPLCEVLHRSLRCNLLCYDYRGYGDSEQAKIDEAGLMQDAHAAWRWLLDQSGVDPTRIVLFGSSLGGAVTIQLARDLCISQEPRTPLPLGVVLQNTFTSIEAMLGAKFPWLDWGFVRRNMLRLRWRSIEHITQVSLPLLFIVGQRDEIVPPVHTHLLQQAAIASPAVHVRRVPDGTHNDTWMKAGNDSFVGWLDDFINEADAKRMAGPSVRRKLE